jgi:hypothetical protein
MTWELLVEEAGGGMRNIGGGRWGMPKRTKGSIIDLVVLEGCTSDAIELPAVDPAALCRPFTPYAPAVFVMP